ncbi:bile acid-CoA:amino acid N-acyltransferase-like [Haliotis rufescens]|uniref:bile acid-CoA:amino acid N-acyltransferase-like n=1 Tax=Haliotis rufescens TaxID=6454 RepID=UPI001EB086F0|nr:bile acid-CoA:amino acid N-acyltransferase-like [Haliotis rufescens]
MRKALQFLQARAMLNMADGSKQFHCKSIRRLQVISRALSLNTSPPTLIVEPTDALVDEPVSIRVSGLQRHQKITLSALLRGAGKEFVSCAHYTADENGHVDTAVQSSEGGSFNGVEPMGLFWAMVPSVKHRRTTRLLNKDITVPYYVTISVQSSRMDLESIQATSGTSGVMAAADVRRWYLKKGVQRLPLRIGRIRGTLFIPLGVGPFPAVLDLFGGTGGLFEFRAALLASRGFLTFALAYLGYDGLPNDFNDLEYGYFQEAAEWLSQHAEASPGGIGVIGTSLGGGITNMLASFCPKVTASVSINGSLFPPLNDQGLKRQGFKGYTPTLKVIDDEYCTSDFDFNNDDVQVLPVWRHGAQMLSIIAEDDTAMPSSVYKEMVRKIPEEKLHTIQSVFYPGAGHLIEPPYAPLCRASYMDEQFVTLMLWGGEMEGHAAAQEDSWKRVLEHFNKYLPRRKTDRL